VGNFHEVHREIQVFGTRFLWEKSMQFMGKHLFVVPIIYWKLSRHFRGKFKFVVPIILWKISMKFTGVLSVCRTYVLFSEKNLFSSGGIMYSFVVPAGAFSDNSKF